MSGKRSKILRVVFEARFGFTTINRDTKEYRREWKRFKKNAMKRRKG